MYSQEYVAVWDEAENPGGNPWNPLPLGRGGSQTDLELRVSRNASSLLVVHVERHTPGALGYECPNTGVTFALVGATTTAGALVL